MDKLPDVSIVMSVYNGESYLKQAVDSILNQTFTNFEFIIINDGSTDGTQYILDNYSLKDSRIRVFCQENKGLTVSLNRGIQQAVGKYIARFDADDISYPTRLELEKNFLDRHSSYVLVASSVYFINEIGDKVGRLYPFMTNYSLMKQIEYINPFVHSSVMIRLDALHKVGGYNSVIKQICEDYNLWYRLKDYGKFKILQKPLVSFRMHEKNMSTLTNLDSAKREISEFIKREDLTKEDFEQLILILNKSKSNTNRDVLNFKMSRLKKVVLLSNIFSYSMSLFKTLIYWSLSHNYLTNLYYNNKRK